MILRRQIKRTRYTKTDRRLLVLLARVVRAWRQTLKIIQPETLLKWHRQGFAAFGSISQANVDTSEGGSRDHRVDQGNGREQSTLGSETYSGRITETGYSRGQTHDPEILRHLCLPRLRGFEGKVSPNSYSIEDEIANNHANGE